MRVDNREYDTEALKRDNPIEDVISGYGIALRRCGAVALVGLCPFHDDREHPNLYVRLDTQSWHCFACPQPNGGDVIHFVERIENVKFKPACAKLLERSGAAPAPSTGSKPARRLDHAPKRFWERLSLDEQELMNRVAHHYHQALLGCGPAMAYVRARGVPDWLIRRQLIGYAHGRSLQSTFPDKIDIDRLVELGLLRRSEDSASPRLTELFRHRVIVPELRAGNCIWLIGRTLRSDTNALKYLALPGERPVLGLEYAAGYPEVLLCEGVFDLLTALAWRLPAFSACGTYLPPDRLGFLARTHTVFGVLDADAAGRLGSERFAELLRRRLRPLALPEGSDLNELGVQPRGREQFFELLRAAGSQLHQQASSGTCE